MTATIAPDVAGPTGTHRPAGRLARHGIQRGDIQGMRAVAVLLVVLDHAGMPGFGGGYIGVDVFFVISGFLITGNLMRSVERTGGVSIPDFYARRARRILPAGAVALVGIVLASYAVYAAGRREQVLDDALWATFFAANVNYGSAGTGYFDTDSFVSPIQHFWSLAVEEQFYLFWPLLIAGCAWLAGRVLIRRRHGHADPARRREVGLHYATVVIAVVAIASLAWSIRQTSTAPERAYFSTLARTWELGIGALLALVATTVARWGATAKRAMSWIGLAAIGVAAVTYSETTAFPGSAALVPVLGAALVLAGGIDGPAGGAAVVLDRGPMRWVGDISYSLYLWHWPCLILPAAWLTRDLRAWESVVAVLVSVVIAWLSFRLVETPVRTARAFDRSRKRTLALWPVSVATVLVSVVAVQAWADWRSPETTTAAVTELDPEPATVQDDGDELVNDVGLAAELARAGVALPADLEPSLDDLLNDVTRFAGPGTGPECGATTEQVTVTICPLGVPGAAKKIVVLGDSHMGMWMSPISRLATEQGYEITPLLKQRCMPLTVTPNGPDGAYTQCPEFQRWAVEQIRRIEPDLIIASALWVVPIVDPATGEVLSGPVGDETYRAGATSTFTQLAGLAPSVVVLGPTPVLPELAMDCVGVRDSTMATCAEPPRADVVTRRALLADASAAAGVKFVDMLPWFCDEGGTGTCPLVIGGRIAYRDQDHITETYADRLLPVFERELGL